jgi:hypothetical protein
MNKQQESKRLKSKIKELEVTKLCLEGAIRTLANEIIRTNDELAIVEGSKPSPKRQKKVVDISRYEAQFFAECERARQNS